MIVNFVFERDGIRYKRKIARVHVENDKQVKDAIQRLYLRQIPKLDWGVDEIRVLGSVLERDYANADSRLFILREDDFLHLALALNEENYVVVGPTRSARAAASGDLTNPTTFSNAMSSSSDTAPPPHVPDATSPDTPFPDGMHKTADSVKHDPSCSATPPTRQDTQCMEPECTSLPAKRPRSASSNAPLPTHTSTRARPAVRSSGDSLAWATRIPVKTDSRALKPPPPIHVTPETVKDRKPQVKLPSACPKETRPVENSEFVGSASSAGTFKKQDLLLLLLGLGQLQSIPCARELVTAQELISCASVCKHIRKQLLSVEYTRCRDGMYYLVPFPGLPGLLCTPDDLKVSAGLYPHQLASLRAAHKMENAHSSFGSLRGGILADAPGLGKTVTMLALIVNTAGIRPVSPHEFWDAARIAAGWKNMRVNPAAGHEILNALKPIRTWIYSEKATTDPCYFRYKALAEYVAPPFTDDRLPTIRDLEPHVHRELQGFGVPVVEFERFHNNMIEIKTRLDKQNRKMMMDRRVLHERKLIPSSGTLVVVPDALLEHWFQQIRNHLNLRYFEDRNAPGLNKIVYLDGIGDIAEARLPLPKASADHDALPPAFQLSHYFIVVTTFSRCETEYIRKTEVGQARRGQASLAARVKRQRSTSQGFSELFKSDDPSTNTSPLHQVRWLRVVIDEWPEMGDHEVGFTRFIHEIAAERRWVLTGTPITGDEDANNYSSRALDRLQSLLAFLRHPKYGYPPSATPNEVREQKEENAKERWVSLVKAPYLERMHCGRAELRRVLMECMIMHRKEDCKLPKPIFSQAEVDVPVPEVIQYKMRNRPNSAADILEAYLQTEEYQSLVDQAQADYIADAIRTAKNRQLHRTGVLVRGEPEARNATFDQRRIKAVVYSHDRKDFNLASVSECFLRDLQKENVADLHNPRAVNMWTELSRFRNNFKDARVCPICQRENDVTWFKAGATQRCLQLLLEVVEETPWGACHFLIEPERVRKPVGSVEDDLETRMKDWPLSSYALNSKFWKQGDILEVDVRSDHPFLPNRKSEKIWAEYGIEECIDHALKDRNRGQDWFFGPLPRRPDAVHTATVRLVKWQPCSSFHNHTRWYKGPRLCDAPIQRFHEDVFLLTLDADLSHGLDLSFVTHIFLLEPIEDAALLEQVTSRAYRLGATGPVRVETVNPFCQLNAETSEILKQSLKDSHSTARQRALTHDYCEFCFRRFDSKALAERHERTNCPRNPRCSKQEDPFHLSSVYRDLKPLPAVCSTRAPVASL